MPFVIAKTWHELVALFRVTSWIDSLFFRNTIHEITRNELKALCKAIYETLHSLCFWS